jgi:hypothetical protein
MPINLIFSAMGKPFMIVIRGKEVFWNDEKSGLQMMYPIPSKKAKEMAGEPTNAELNEYRACQTEEQIMAIVIKDLMKSGCRLIKREIT